MTDPAPYLPDTQQRDLLRACLLDDAEAAAAFFRWRAIIDLDRLDGGSVRLLPLLATRLSRLGIDDALFGKYRGVQRLAWAQNQLLLQAARPLLGALAGAGIRPLLLKGAALSSAIYPQLSMRLMGDLDLLVPRAATDDAIAILVANGWRPSIAPPRSASDYSFHHGLGFARPGGERLEVDLHWRLLPWHTDPVAEAALFERALPVLRIGPAAYMPGLADMLLHVCAHGTRWNPLPPIRWIADAMMILRHGPIDWPHLIAQCGRFGLAPQMLAAVDYLTTEMQAPIPADVRATLASIPVRRIDRIAFALEQEPPEKRRFLDYYRLHAHRARTLVGRTPLAILRYANRMRDDRSARETFRWLCRRATQ